MAQHFLLSAAARTLSLRSIYAAGEDEAYRTFCRIRWHETGGEPVCPRCGSLDAYEITTRRKFKCRAPECRHQFSVTSGTIFASRKMSFTDLLGAICIFVNGVKGIAACQLSRDLDCQYKTAFVLLHKLREALNQEIAGQTLDDEVEIDGTTAVTFALRTVSKIALTVACQNTRPERAASWLRFASAAGARFHSSRCTSAKV